MTKKAGKHYLVHTMNNEGNERTDAITLKILDEISRDSTLTQRTLAGRLDIALGLVNIYIKRLAKKGYIKITKGPMNRVKYVLTTEGFTHRVGLTYNYINSSLKYFKDLRQRIDSVYLEMVRTGVKDILIWGDGEIAELSYISMRGLPLRLIGIVDGTGQGKDFFGHSIYAADELTGLDYDAILIASFDMEELQRLKSLGIDENKIYSL